MDRRGFIGCGALAGLGAIAGTEAKAGEAATPGAHNAGGPPRETAAAAVPPFELDEVTVDELQRQMAAGQRSSQQITQAYLQRIAELDRKGPELRSVIETNPEALEIAAALDAERKAKGPRGPLHGIPLLLKDNVGTADRMETTAGSLALQGARPPRDAFLVERLRAAGAIVLGKANLTEWANFRSTHAVSGW